MAKVSVIVPIYGVERYIERCARSLFEQSLEDMEFIFVDDCTKDDSIKVLENIITEYPHRQKQIVILHHEKNKGLSRARETGYKAATGEYIAHCDSDDWIQTNAYESLYNYATSNNYDFVKSAHFESDCNKHTIKTVYGKDYIEKEEAIEYLLRCKGWNSIWDTLVHRDTYHRCNVRFTDDTMLEDFFVVTQLLLASNKIGILQTPFYYYFQNPNSICHVSDDQSVIGKAFQAHRNVIFILQEVYKEYSNQFNKEELVLKYIPRRIMIPAMTSYANFSYWSQIIHSNIFKFLITPYLSRVQKLQYLLVVLRIYPIYNKILRR